MSETGDTLYKWMEDLFPICRSITGEGVRKTLHYIKKIIPQLQIYEIPSGTKVFDWTVPDEWNIKDAFVMDKDGKKIIDFKKNNLHVLGYSCPIDQRMQFEELDQHLYSLPEQPNAIPYVTSYYQKKWGFCLTENKRRNLRSQPQKEYFVKIDATLKPGFLNYAELKIPGKTSKEIFLSTYVCHPSMANNELSGPVVAAALAKWIQRKASDIRYTYRIVFIPETIGAIAYLSQHLNEMKENIVAGFNLSCLGDERTYSYLPSRQGDTLADQVARHVLDDHAVDYIHWSFLDRGSDERQYCSPGVDLPVASIMRSKYGSYPEYHTSLDNLTFISRRGLEGSLIAYKKCIRILETNWKYKINVLCEPQLGKRGLYPTLSTKETEYHVRKMMDFVAYADGKHTLLDIANKIGIFALDLIPTIKNLEAHGLLEKWDH